MGKKNKNKKGDAFLREMTGSAPMVNLDGESEKNKIPPSPKTSNK
ncbi:MULTISPECIES: hypothetical protein [Pelotomaculum]|nr:MULTISPECIES: hypothetical protein [Pelotomaculum]OPX84066.1 MAG: hypothetical protein A4E54_03032 [Pelotomaculum sp. PtaB.Bin117]OPY60852.1 MAG: hypothetical protein A4E56_02430 [Pelotomaculum sp. PtaU1.Bin065]